MAWQNAGWVWHVVGVRGSHYVTLLYLADQAGAGGETDRFISLSKLASACNVTYDTARRLTSDLQNWGLIDIQSQTRPGNEQQIQNSYRIHKERLFPKTSDLEQSGEDIGSYIWAKLLEELQRMRGQGHKDIEELKNYIQQAYFDSSNRPTKTERFHGVLHLFAKSSNVQDAFDKNLKFMAKLRDHIQPYLVDYFEYVFWPDFDARSEQQEEPC